MPGRTTKEAKRREKFADATRVLEEFRARYPRDRPAPARMVFKASTWDLLVRSEGARAETSTKRPLRSAERITVGALNHDKCAMMASPQGDRRDR